MPSSVKRIIISLSDKNVKRLSNGERSFSFLTFLKFCPNTEMVLIRIYDTVKVLNTIIIEVLMQILSVSATRFVVYCSMSNHRKFEKNSVKVLSMEVDYRKQNLFNAFLKHLIGYKKKKKIIKYVNRVLNSITYVLWTKRSCISLMGSRRIYNSII